MIKLQEYKEGEVVLPEANWAPSLYVRRYSRNPRQSCSNRYEGAIFGELSEILGEKRCSRQAKTAAKVGHVEESIADIVTKTPKWPNSSIITGRRLCRMNKIAPRGDSDFNIFKKLTGPKFLM